MTHPQPPGLAVHCGEQTRIISPSQGEVTIGRSPASAIRLDHSWLSRSHVRLRADDDRWIAADCSSNGMFVDGEKRQSVVVTAGLTMHLGRPDGPAVRFSFVDIVADESESDEDADPDIARAGAAVAARRRELDLTQRGLARDRIINAGALISFEKGRSWPHESTRTRLEQVLQWPAGAIAGASSEWSRSDQTCPLPPTAIRSAPTAMPMAWSNLRNENVGRPSWAPIATSWPAW